MHMGLVDLQQFAARSQWAQHSADLDALAAGDFAPAERQLRSMIDDEDLFVRKIPFVQKYVSEVSGQLLRPHTRRFVTSDNTELPQAGWAKLAGVYDASGVGAAMADAEAALWVQRTVLLLPVPVGVGRVSVQVIRPWQVSEVVAGDPLQVSDPASWVSCKIKLPAAYLAQHVVYEEAVITRNDAWRSVGGQRVGIYSPNGSHPFGRVPIIAMHQIRPRAGDWWCGPAEAVLSLALALCVDVTDFGRIISSTAYPQRYLAGGTSGVQQDTVTLGPNKMPHFPSAGVEPGEAAPEIKIAQGTVAVEQLATWVERTIMWSCQMLDLNTDAFLRTNTATTASARLYAAQDRKARHDLAVPILRRAETELAQLLAQWLHVSELVPMPWWPQLRVDLSLTDALPVVDPQAQVQTQNARYQAGLSTPDEDVAAAEGIPLSAAARRVDQRLERNRALGLVRSPDAGADTGTA